MPRVKDKPLTLNEDAFIDWMVEVYYFRVMDQGMPEVKTPLRLSTATPEASKEFLTSVRAQMLRFDLTFPLTKIPALYAKALREISPKTSTAGAA